MADIQKYSASCDICTIAKNSQWKYKPKLTPMIRPSTINDCLVIDTVGALPKTEKGHQHVLSCIDTFSRYCFLEPIPDLSTDTILYTLQKIFSTTGVPSVIITDNYATFLSKAVQAYYSLLGIKNLHSAAYSPRSTGIIERLHKDLGNALRCQIVNKQQNDWDRDLSLIEHAFRFL